MGEKERERGVFSSFRLLQFSLCLLHPALSPPQHSIKQYICIQYNTTEKRIMSSHPRSSSVARLALFALLGLLLAFASPALAARHLHATAVSSSSSNADVSMCMSVCFLCKRRGWIGDVMVEKRQGNKRKTTRIPLFRIVRTKTKSRSGDERRHRRGCQPSRLHCHRLWIYCCSCWIL